MGNKPYDGKNFSTGSKTDRICMMDRVLLTQ